MWSSLSAFVALSIIGATFGAPTQESNIGCFWHLTDIHYDKEYKSDGPTREKSEFYKDGKYNDPICKKIGGGKFGDYNCDSSWALVISAIDFINTESTKLTCNPFIIWTGDDNSHKDDSNFNTTIVLDNIDKISKEIVKRIQPEQKVFPVLGNHDIDPKSQFPGNQSDPNYGYYKQVADIWKDWLQGKSPALEDLTAYDQFRVNGGYYIIEEPDLPFTMIGLNTNLYYGSNKLTTDMEDPLSQLTFLDKKLAELGTNNKKALIFGHVTPGMFERYYETRLKGTMKGKAWFTAKFNEKYLNIINMHADVIVGQVYGHQHSDAMKVTGDKTFALLAPAVTPWRTTLSEEGGSNNPAVRLVKFDSKNGQIVDYDQYWLNLVEANKAGKADWQKLYSFVDYYKHGRPSAESITAIAEEMRNNTETFKKYYAANTVNYEQATNETCDGRCLAFHYCSALKQDYVEFDLCVNQNLQSVAITSHSSSQLLWVTATLFYFANRFI